jgi:hypothetical protein
MAASVPAPLTSSCRNLAVTPTRPVLTGREIGRSMKAKSRKAKSSPTLTIDPKHCRIHPSGRVHAPRKSARGFVDFHATAPCTILFTNPAVFGRPFVRLSRGPNKRFTRVDRGHTLVMIAGCEYKIPRSLGAASNPTDIIVP